MSDDTCLAVKITPGQKDSAVLEPYPVRSPGRGELLLEALEVGICGTDLEIVSGLYGEAPKGEEKLVIGHESLLRVVEAGEDSGDFQPGDLAIGIVRRPCDDMCPACAQGRWDLCVTGHYRERGIARLDGFMRQRLVEEAPFVVHVPESLRRTGVLLEPLTIVEKAVGEALSARPSFLAARRALVTGAGPVGLLAALLLISKGLEVWVLDRVDASGPKGSIVLEAGGRYVDDSSTPLETEVGDIRFDVAVEASGYAPLLFRAANLLARDGVLVLTGVTGGHHTISVDAALLNTDMVLENQVMMGSVNAARPHYEAAVRDMEDFGRRFGTLPERLITRRLPLREFQSALFRTPDDIKAVLEVSA